MIREKHLYIILHGSITSQFMTLYHILIIAPQTIYVIPDGKVHLNFVEMFHFNRHSIHLKRKYFLV